MGCAIVQHPVQPMKPTTTSDGIQWFGTPPMDGGFSPIPEITHVDNTDEITDNTNLPNIVTNSDTSISVRTPQGLRDVQLGPSLLSSSPGMTDESNNSSAANNDLATTTQSDSWESALAQAQNQTNSNAHQATPTISPRSPLDGQSSSGYDPSSRRGSNSKSSPSTSGNFLNIPGIQQKSISLSQLENMEINSSLTSAPPPLNGLDESLKSGLEVPATQIPTSQSGFTLAESQSQGGRSQIPMTPSFPSTVNNSQILLPPMGSVQPQTPTYPPLPLQQSQPMPPQYMTPPPNYVQVSAQQMQYQQQMQMQQQQQQYNPQQQQQYSTQQHLQSQYQQYQQQHQQQQFQKQIQAQQQQIMMLQHQLHQINSNNINLWQSSQSYSPQGQTIQNGHCFYGQKPTFTQPTLTGPVGRIDESATAYSSATQKEDHTCTVCMSRRANTILVPCGHNACCAGCSSGLLNCPLCRALIHSIKQLPSPNFKPPPKTQPHPLQFSSAYPQGIPPTQSQIHAQSQQSQPPLQAPY